jgi:MoaA/NifB/PqqE/SkfB family radical SAM enzyme
VSIETLALCNAACIFCPYPTLERQGAKLDTGVINRLIEQMQDWREPFFVSPFKVNEPLLDARLPHICQAIEHQCPQARLRLFTNGQPLVSRHVEWIADLKRVEHLWISLNSTDPHEYGRLMKCSYHLVAGNLDELHHKVTRGDFTHPVVLSRVIQGDSTADTSPQRLLSDADANFHRECLARWPHFHTHLIKRDAWLGYVSPSDPRVPRRACGRWFELSITAQGKAVLCCMDGQGEYVQGDVATQSLLDIYNNVFLTKCRHASVREGIEPCQSCSY